MNLKLAYHSAMIALALFALLGAVVTRNGFWIVWMIVTGAYWTRALEKLVKKGEQEP